MPPSPLIIAAPDGERAFVLAQALARYSADVLQDGDGWRVVVRLQNQPRGCVPDVLAAVREWLDGERIAATTLTVDGHARVLHALRQPAAGPASRTPDQVHSPA